MRSAAHAEHRAMHSQHHGRDAAPPPGELKQLAFSAGMVWQRTFPLRTAAMQSFWPSKAAFRWELPATGALPALTPFVPGALAAAVLNSFDWCFGEVRVTLAVCLIGAVASGTLLLCWSFDPASMRRSIAYAVAAGLSAAAPLLQFG